MKALDKLIEDIEFAVAGCETRSDWQARIAAAREERRELVEALAGVVRICEAMRLSTGLGKHQQERLTKAQDLLAKHKEPARE